MLGSPPRGNLAAPQVPPRPGHSLAGSNHVLSPKTVFATQTQWSVCPSGRSRSTMPRRYAVGDGIGRTMYIGRHRMIRRFDPPLRSGNQQDRTEHCDSGQRARRRMMPVKLRSEQYCSQIRNQSQLQVLIQYRRIIWAVIGD
jgi:hypothetical protein